jgi:3-oxoacyl-[acyl-carrier-protein] synthase II
MPVVVTGMGTVTPAGNSVEEFRRSVWGGHSAVGELSGGELQGGKTRLAAQVKDFLPPGLLSLRELGRMDRAAQMAVAAIDQALTDARLSPRDHQEETGRGTGVVMGTGVGNAHAIEQSYFAYFSRKSTSVHNIPSCMPHSAAAVAGIRFGLTGPSFTVSAACASGAVAIGMAFELIRAGMADTMLAGGCDASITPIHLDNWRCLGVLAKGDGEPGRAVRPFSRDREGFVLGEGAAVVVLEKLESALRRGATIYGEVLGYGFSSDAMHLTAPSVCGQAKAMANALAAAGVEPREVDYINAHGTGTVLNDQAETAAIRRVFGDAVPPVSSIKPVTGHMLGASSAAELVASVLAVRDGVIPPTINLSEADPDCDLDFVVEGPRDVDARVAVSNSFAFGGNNAVLVVRRFE